MSCSDCSGTTIGCDPVDGCTICEEGWTGYNCEDNIDECANSLLFNCTAKAFCEDTPGSYVCTCESGYVKDQTNTFCEGK